MIGLTLLAASIGSLLGFVRYRVTVLVPAFSVLLIAVGLFSVTTGLDGWRTPFAGILGTVGLQVGYVLAVLGRFVHQNMTVRAKSSAPGMSRFI